MMGDRTNDRLGPSDTDRSTDGGTAAMSDAPYDDATLNGGSEPSDAAPDPGRHAAAADGDAASAADSPAITGSVGLPVGSDQQAHAGDHDGIPVAQLEREGDIAADYLEALLDIADMDGDIDLDVENDRAIVSIVGADLEDLVGAGGRGLDALQELTRLAVLRETGQRSRLMLDIAGTRARRRVELTAIGADAADRARSTSAPVSLASMNPFERKVVHDAVAAAGLRSESEGVEPDRRVVVYPV